MFLWACILVAVLLVIAGGVVALRAALHTKRRVEAIRDAAPGIVDVERAKADAERLRNAVDGIVPLLDRAKLAIDRINAGLRDLKLPQAIFALRTAGAAIRLLMNGR